MIAISGCSPRRGAASGEEPSVSLPPQSSAEERPSEPESSKPEESESSADEESRDDKEDDKEDDEESAITAMSMEHSQIAAVDGGLLEWGSGGPTDQSGRPNGATLYQQKYGKYDAYFILPASEKVYLTFDEGYEYGFTPMILDTLKEKGVTAVFFITGHFARTEHDLVRRMIDEGHVIGNHSGKHKIFPSMPLSEAAEDITSLHEYVKSTFGYEMNLFRFPEGKFSEQTLALLQSLGYKSVFWSFAYLDYDVNNQPLTIDALERITSKAHPGAIYLLHAVSRTNAEVLGEAIDAIRNKGYTFAKLDVD